MSILIIGTKRQQLSWNLEQSTCKGLGTEQDRTRVLNFSYRTAGYIGWRNLFLRIDSWAPLKFKNTVPEEVTIVEESNSFCLCRNFGLLAVFSFICLKTTSALHSASYIIYGTCNLLWIQHAEAACLVEAVCVLLSSLPVSVCENLSKL